MAMKKKPVTGMKDITPREMEIRDYVIRMIKDTYGTFGFSSIETPCVEHIENLSSKQGGENEKLIFKILKRGEKLKIDTAETEMDLVDGGLRYDLTVPLSRYYANNTNNLPSPFKALQMGNVWRADRPQRGRYRQFMQCDIDILGEPTILAEIELILATSTLVGKLDFENFTIRINDRRILKAMAACSGFPEESYDTVFIILDKMDKIGKEGVAEELEKEGINCNLTLLFSFAQARACAEAGVFLISPFVGRIYDWYQARKPMDPYVVEEDPGVKSVRNIYDYYKQHHYETIVMGASFRRTEQILALTGCDRLTIAPNLLKELQEKVSPVVRKLIPPSQTFPRPAPMSEAEFRWEHNQDAMAVEKLSEGIRLFAVDQRKLEDLLAAKL